MKGYEHRIGGLEKADVTGAVSHEPENHQKMTEIRQEKIAKVVDNIPLQEVEGSMEGDILVLSWGGTYGACHAAVRRAHKDEKKVSLAHLRYMNPFPKNLGEIIS